MVILVHRKQILGAQEAFAQEVNDSILDMNRPQV